MPDIYPYGPPLFLDWNTVFNYLQHSGANTTVAAILTAIGVAESSLDVTVINDTPSTGDYSVGIWQINYYGSDYAPRVAEFGTPEQLILGGLAAQARAALTIANQSGFTPWSTYNNGSYAQYLHGYGGIPPQTQPGHAYDASLYAEPLPDFDSSDSYRDIITYSADKLSNIYGDANAYAAVLDAIQH